MTSQSEHQSNDEPELKREGPTVIRPTEARQGEIILGRGGRILWIAVFGVIVLIVIASAIL